MSLRPYQKEAVDAAVVWMKRTTDTCVIEAPTGAGKSHIIAAIADFLFVASGKRYVLCIAPSAELVVQNREKFIQRTGQNAGLMSASAGKVTMRYPVIFGTPGTVVNRIDRLAGRVCAVVIDEAHGVTATLRTIVDGLREKYENLRVIGLTATPYRLGDGYIFQTDETGRAYGEDQARDPYFVRRVYSICARHLIDEGYLTPPVVGRVESEAYNTNELKKDRLGRFSKDTVDAAFIGHGRLTSEIVKEVVEQSIGRRGVMLFGATIEHCEEIMASLPPDLSRMVTGKTPKKERKKILDDFKAENIKYLVNVSVLTTGFDAPHVDVIALLRATESVGLMQQMIGRGLRICDGKEDCLVLDYAGNVERHCPDGDLFSPDIKAGRESGSGFIEVLCENCNGVNRFSPKPDIDQWDEYGYAVDLTGQRLMTDYGPMPAHYGRRCQHLLQAYGAPTHHQCEYRWTFKECPACEAENDIAARRCCECKEEMVNPNEKLRLEFAAYKKDPYKKQCETVVECSFDPFTSRKGNPCMAMRINTTHRKNLDFFFTDKSGVAFVQSRYDAVKDATDGFTKAPETVSFKKDKNSGYFILLDMNKPEDEAPE